MSALKTAGELRGFLAGILVGIKDGTIDANKANAIAKVSAQINQSLSVEVNTALQMERLGKGSALPGSMIIAGEAVSISPVVDDTPTPLPISPPPPPPPPAPVPPPVAKQVTAQPAPKIATPKRDGDKVWCEQCESRVTSAQAIACRSAHCKAQSLI